MNPSPHRGFDTDHDTATHLVDRAEAATLIDDPQHPRQQAMRALVEAERARVADDRAAENSTPSDHTRLGFLVPDLTEADPPIPLPSHALVPIHHPEEPRHELGTVQSFEELPLPEVETEPPAAPRSKRRPDSLPWRGQWVELEERIPSSVPMVRAVSEDSLAEAECPPQVIRSTNPPPGPERSVVVQQVSPFGSDARVVAKPKPRPAIPPQGETLPFASGSAESPRRAPAAAASEDWAFARTSAEHPNAPADRRAGVVSMSNEREVTPQRYIPTQVHAKPDYDPSPVRAAARVRRDLLPLTSALCAVVVAVAALVNVLI